MHSHIERQHIPNRMCCQILYLYRLCLLGLTAGNRYIGCFCQLKIRLVREYAIRNADNAVTFDTDIHILAEIKVCKLDSGGIFHLNVREEHLAACKHIARCRTQDSDTHALVEIGVIEGAGCAGAVGIVLGLLFAVINEVADGIAVKAAAHKYIVATVVDAAVQIPGAGHIGEVMELAEMADVDTGTAVVDTAVRNAMNLFNEINDISSVEEINEQ